MLRFRRWFRGDTLIEVTIAIGIFALVAISVVAVVNISTSGAQSALENTLAREEVDSQAETLRFIQSAYVNDSRLDDAGATENPKIRLYKAIWDKVKELANDEDTSVDFEREFKPKSCADLYEVPDDQIMNSLSKQNAFIIDIRKLNAYDSPYADKDVENFANQVVLLARNDNRFIEAVTYPHLVYRKDDTLSEDGEGSLVSGGSYSVLDKVEGIFIVGVKDKNTTTIVTEDEEEPVLASTYYDFYVRSCWYNAGSEVPSTVSTLIRLRDPDVHDSQTEP